jgi:hypothetical protein
MKSDSACVVDALESFVRDEGKSSKIASEKERVAMMLLIILGRPPAEFIAERQLCGGYDLGECLQSISNSLPILES